LKRDVIAQTLTDISDLDNIRIAQKPVVLHALGVYVATTLDWVDCLLMGYAKENGHTISTFDKKLQKYWN
jgi:predicted nucleic-acid-binding protein